MKASSAGAMIERKLAQIELEPQGTPFVGPSRFTGVRMKSQGGVKRSAGRLGQPFCHQPHYLTSLVYAAPRFQPPQRKDDGLGLG